MNDCMQKCAHDKVDKRDIRACYLILLLLTPPSRNSPVFFITVSCLVVFLLPRIVKQPSFDLYFSKAVLLLLICSSPC